MVTIWQESEIKQWWVQVKTQHDLFFHLINGEAPSGLKFRNIELCIETLQANYDLIERAYVPAQAAPIRRHLLNATENLISSLTRYRDRQLFESDIRFDVAQVDLNMLQAELLKQGIID